MPTVVTGSIGICDYHCLDDNFIVVSSPVRTPGFVYDDKVGIMTTLGFHCKKHQPWTIIEIKCRYMMTSSNGIFSALLAICAENSPVTGEFSVQMPVTRSFDIFLDMRPNKRLSKQWWGWWFETPSRSLGRHCNYIPSQQFVRLPLGLSPIFPLWCTKL